MDFIGLPKCNNFSVILVVLTDFASSPISFLEASLRSQVFWHNFQQVGNTTTWNSEKHCQRQGQGLHQQILGESFRLHSTSLNYLTTYKKIDRQRPLIAV